MHPFHPPQIVASVSLLASRVTTASQGNGHSLMAPSFPQSLITSSFLPHLYLTLVVRRSASGPASRFLQGGWSSHTGHHPIRMHKVACGVVADFFQSESSASASGDDGSHDTGRRRTEHLQCVCTQCHKAVRRADRVAHFLGHSNLKEWACTW